MAAKESPVFSHLDREGRARMVDISAKPRVKRIASAAGKIRLKPETLQAIRGQADAKGRCTVGGPGRRNHGGQKDL